ncbi:MAG: flagellar hook-associated protein FlgK [Candidatus Marinimicrobia bacterium]|nr:flagellar hook-associated protein FlgK [Candidatus Neomarinimicrobiota bacterium]|tara:strand:+ start:10253 stop:11593 length:1341 start_codon:yes stop_codon:yes gene_type:complete
MSISNILEISKRSLLNHQSAINTTANNIANVYTEGYTRRTVDLSKLSLGFGQMNESAVSRMKNRFLDNQIWYENQALGKESMNEMLMTQVETIFGEPSDAGLSNIMTEFWNAWSNLANTPESESARSLVRDKGILLSNTFNRLDRNLKNLQRQSGIDIQQKVNEVNQLIVQLGTVNKQIDSHRSDDLLDQRDVLLSELSQKVDISVTENESGTVEVIAGGHILVSEDYTNQLKGNTRQDKDGLFHIEIRTIEGDKSVDAKSGQLGGMLEFHNVHISRFMSSINEAAIALSKEVNHIHSNGFNLTGLTEMNFFNENVTGARDFGITAEILSDSTLIATSSDPDSQGDSVIAQAISDLQFSKLIKGKSVMDHYNSIIADVGNKVQEARFIHNNQEKIVQQLQIQKASVTGVSLDEEMTQLIQFEQAYEAAARMISTLDEMVQTVLSIK